jgi:hypothetical protein
MLLADYQQTGHEGEVIRYLRAAPCSKDYSEKSLKHSSAAFRSSVFYFKIIVLSGTVVVKKVCSELVCDEEWRF